jgi:transposase-like protein
MNRTQIGLLKLQLTTASAAQILEIEDEIQCIISQQITEMALARRTRQTVQERVCPHCHSGNALLYGKDQNRRQRFKCRSCRKTYNIMTGTGMARARKPEKWAKYLSFMTQCVFR